MNIKNAILIKILNGRDYVEKYYLNLIGARGSFLEPKIKTSMNAPPLKLKTLQRSLDACVCPLRLRIASELEDENSK